MKLTSLKLWAISLMTLSILIGFEDVDAARTRTYDQVQASKSAPKSKKPNTTRKKAPIAKPKVRRRPYRLTGPTQMISSVDPKTGLPRLESSSAMVVDVQGNVIFSKAEQEVRPIASITKLMTAMVVLDQDLPMDEVITITSEDQDKLRHSRSRLRPDQAALTRGQMLHVALMSSENRAASALGRTTFPGGITEFVDAMNRKAQKLGMVNTKFADSTGLLVTNVSTAADLVKMLEAARNYPLIHQATSTPEADFSPYANKPPLHYVNTNRLVHYQNPDWEVLISKTGFINEAGRCLVMEARLPQGTYDFVFLNAPGKLSPIGDSNRLRNWITQRGQSVKSM
jgi:D-alanyl-D-alanine endopeptidase (penicillin-binding protein 7)